ncbi:MULTISPECIES: hypothetical protein [Acinetobacter]|jgi:hypothetical protein|uniref:Uncharacterized protein n=1 Tax=Acinetobacter seifertii TaxID=1530123 RepID=A0A7H2VFG4_9GAMM|nr:MULTISPECIES: hypothetical protein [Acinetobacter]YP_009289785.1 putative lipoprotein [Acinetobacter phage vB_AbaS_TRS1]ANT40758.1 putative lipoprotein [Acinetobacter phage vB_AbaS_TRS1]EHZ6729975.1 hypothetical protein [Acinetobacter baumannii]EJB8486619.1 hypothetical protein [Acinetobacter baumannii]EKT8700701.1 hypothetical protein [Acinetobacter baumannii]EKV2133446.1 hypothetical protein [Acinetobacter baumannii]
MFGELVKKIKTWYKGDPGLIDSNPATGIDTIIREPYRSPVARFLSYFIEPFIALLILIKQEWKYFLTTFLTLITVLIAVLSYIDKMKVC